MPALISVGGDYIMKRNTLIAVLVALLGWGCEKTETPAFLHIEKIELDVPGNFSQGTADHGILDARVYINDDLIGIYEMPATVPVIAEGEQKVTIIAGILNNGIRSARVDYPFYDLYNTTLSFVPGETIDFSADTENTVIVNGYSCPVVKYFEGLEFWHERFEEPGVQFEATSSSDASMVVTLDPSKIFNYDPDNDSKGSGIVTLTSNEPYFEVKSSHVFSPVRGRNVYLELNYFSPCTLQVGVYEESPTFTKVYGKGILPSEGWSKIYIELTQEIAQRINANSYSLFIEGLIEPGQTQAEVLIDNVKLVYPQ